MGKIVVFRSDIERAGRVTSCMAAVAGFLAADTEMRIAVVQFGEKNDICGMFDRHMPAGCREEVYRKTGLSALVLCLKADRPDEEKVRGCALKTVCPKLDLFHGRGPGLTDCEDEEICRLVLPELKKAYDLVLFDAGTGRWEADFTVNLLTQSRKAWSDAIGNGKISNEKGLYAVNGFLENSVCSRSLFRMKYGKRLFTLGMSAGFMDALEEGNTAEFFGAMGKLGKVGRMLPDHGFAEDVSALAKEIIKGGQIGY